MRTDQIPWNLRDAFVPVARRTSRSWGFGVPLGLCLSMAPGAILLPPVLRARYRRRRKRCVDCSYPRDEQLERCPECGRPTSEPSPGLWLLAWRAYRWPLACIAVNVAVTLVAIEVMN